MTRKARKGRGVLVKIPLTELEQSSFADRVKKHLQVHPTEAFSKVGLIVEILSDRFRKEQFNGPYGSWPEGGASLYHKVGIILKELTDNKLVDRRKLGRASVYFWIGPSVHDASAPGTSEHAKKDT